MQISISNESAATAWLKQVLEIDEAYKIAMEEAAHTLEGMNEFASGTLVDDIVNLGHSLLNAGQTIFNCMDEIADTVADVVGKVGAFVDETKDKIKSTFQKLFG